MDNIAGILWPIVEAVLESLAVMRGYEAGMNQDPEFDTLWSTTQSTYGRTRQSGRLGAPVAARLRCNSCGRCDSNAGSALCETSV
jgi:hypothetical protein